MISALIAIRDSAVASVLLKNQNYLEARHEFHEPARINPNQVSPALRDLIRDHSCNSCLKKLGSLEVFGNFVPNFREQMANDKHYPKGKPKGKHL